MPSSQKIRKRRQELGLSLRQLAKIISKWLPGIDDSDLSKIEQGRRKVRLDEAPYFAKSLSCRIEDLVDEVEE